MNCLTQILYKNLFSIPETCNRNNKSRTRYCFHCILCLYLLGVNKREYLSLEEIGTPESLNLEFCTIKLVNTPETCNQNFHLSKTVEHDTVSD